MAEKGSDNSFDFISLGSLSSWYSLLLFRKNVRHGPDNLKKQLYFEKNTIIMHTTISYYFTQTVYLNRTETCMHNNCTGLHLLHAWRSTKND